MRTMTTGCCGNKEYSETCQAYIEILAPPFASPSVLVGCFLNSKVEVNAHIQITSRINALNLCDNFNKNNIHRLINLNGWSTGSGTIRMCDLVEGSASLGPSQAHWLYFSLLPAHLYVEIAAASPVPYLSTCCHAPHHEN